MWERKKGIKIIAHTSAVEPQHIFVVHASVTLDTNLVLGVEFEDVHCTEFTSL